MHFIQSIYVDMTIKEYNKLPYTVIIKQWLFLNILSKSRATKKTAQLFYKKN